MALVEHVLQTFWRCVCILRGDGLSFRRAGAHHRHFWPTTLTAYELGRCLKFGQVLHSPDLFDWLGVGGRDVPLFVAVWKNSSCDDISIEDPLLPSCNRLIGKRFPHCWATFEKS